MHPHKERCQAIGRRPAFLSQFSPVTHYFAPVSLQASHRLETYDDVPPSRTYVIRGLRQLLEEAGVEFIGSPWDGPGVRLWKQIEPAP